LKTISFEVFFKYAFRKVHVYQDGFKILFYTSAFDVCWWCWYIGQKITCFI